MTDSKKIEIAQIQQIKVIYLYKVDLEFNAQKNLFGLKVSYADHKTLSYDYRSPYFEMFFNKVLECYVEENKTARLFGDLTKQVVSDILENSIPKTKKRYSEIAVFYEHFLYKDMMKEYLYEIARTFLSIHINLDYITFGDITGFKYKYFLHYKFLNINVLGSKEEQDGTLAIALTPQTDFKHHFVIRLFDCDHDFVDTCEGFIRHTEESIYIYWKSIATGLESNSLYSSEKKYNESTLTYNEKTIALEQKEKTLSNEEENMLNAYASLCFNKKYGFSSNNSVMDCRVMKIVKDHYLLYQEYDLGMGDVQKEYIYFTFLNDILLVNRKSLSGKLYEKEQTFIPVLSEQEKVIATPVLYHDKRCLFLQHHYLDSKYTTGKYQNEQQNKYSYQLVNAWIPKTLKDISDFIMDNVKDITDKDDSLMEVKKQLTLKKGGV